MLQFLGGGGSILLGVGSIRHMRCDYSLHTKSGSAVAAVDMAANRIVPLASRVTFRSLLTDESTSIE
eukprot:4793419-Pyramimonas_sp.AAC.1